MLKKCNIYDVNKMFEIYRPISNHSIDDIKSLPTLIENITKGCPWTIATQNRKSGDPAFLHGVCV